MNSFTGEDMIEISCHGGTNVKNSVVRAAVESGARIAGPGEFSLRSFLNGKMDLVQAEAVSALISSKGRLSTKIGIETSGRQNLWGSLEEVLEVVNHVEGSVPVINFAHIHARGHGRLKTSEDYGELFDQVRETIGSKEFYCCAYHTYTDRPGSELSKRTITAPK